MSHDLLKEIQQGESHLHFSNIRLYLPSHKTITTTIAGIIIGLAGLITVQDPPSATLAKEQVAIEVHLAKAHKVEPHQNVAVKPDPQVYETK